ncbi:hypothetical protein [Paraburkholderia sp. 40]|uniref:hypothetical protein n=1 Tax=unclassified Paraburkholderia TaxID=2615204 RepID=UPI003D25B3FF
MILLHGRPPKSQREAWQIKSGRIAFVPDERPRGASDGLLSSKDSLQIGASSINGALRRNTCHCGENDKSTLFNFDKSRRAFIRATMKLSMFLT